MRNFWIIVTLFEVLCYYPGSSGQRTCRMKDQYLYPEVFDIFSCGKCYTYLFHKKKAIALKDKLVLYHDGKQILTQPDTSNKSSVNVICSTLNGDQCQRWLSCCNDAHVCCQRQVSSLPPDENSTCSRTWDGWSCWDDAEPGTLQYIACPLFIKHSLPTRYAVKTCMSNGSWLMSNGNYWTDYKPCLSYEEMKTALFLGLGCSIASMIVLIPSIFIFIRYKSLRKQHRIRLHINLFFALLLKEIMTVLWDMLVTYDRISTDNASGTVIAKNGGGCKVLAFLKIYFKCASYTWMFCEGFYLHRLMSNAFSPPRSLISLYGFGWGIPMVSSVIYAVLRAVLANESCWSKSFEHKEWIFDAPNLACLIVNLIFLCDILRILLTQLQSHPNEPSNFRRAVKATFVLIPLFGVQLFVTIYRLPTSETGGLEYERFTILVNNLQGFFVSLIFCFLNGEVTSHLKRTWRRRIRDRYSFGFKRSGRTLSRSDAELSRNTEALSLRTTSVKTHENGTKILRNGGILLSKDSYNFEDTPLTETDNIR